MAVVLPVNVIDGVIGGAVISHAVGSPALGATTAVHAATAVLASGGPQVITTGITSPAVPRNVTATAGGTAGDIKAVQVTVTGTNMAGAVITSIPVLLLYILLQRYIVESVQTTGLKG